MRQDQDLLGLLLELQSLDRVPRSGYNLRGVSPPESVSEHLFHVAFMAWTLAAEESQLDRLRVVELALVHDLAEVRSGDLPRSIAHYLPPGAKKETEKAIASDLLAPLGAKGPELFAEYQAKTSPEARFVGACDRLQLLVKTQVYEEWGSRGLDEFWQHLEELVGSEFASIRQTARQLRHRRQGQAEASDQANP
jgi:putative hydrolase of HD superfamily